VRQKSAWTATWNSPAKPRYKDIPFQVAAQGNEKKISGTIPSLTDFKIDPPTLLTMPIKNDIPLKVEMTWKQQCQNRTLCWILPDLR
jgi:hypothetical protein